MKIFKKLNNRGFSHVEAFIIVIALVAIGGIYTLVKDFALVAPWDSGGNVYSTLNPAVDFGGLNYTVQACYTGSQVDGLISVNRQAGPTTVIKNSKGVITNRGYNPLGAGYTASGGNVYTDSWLAGNPSTITLTLNLSKTDKTFKFGILGYLGGTKTQVMTQPYSYNSVVNCATGVVPDPVKTTKNPPAGTDPSKDPNAIPTLEKRISTLVTDIKTAQTDQANAQKDLNKVELYISQNCNKVSELGSPKCNESATNADAAEIVKDKNIIKEDQTTLAADQARLKQLQA